MIETDKLIEKAAFALFKKRGLAHTHGSAEDSWERSKGTIVARELLSDVRTIVEAMRDPSHSMIEAAYLKRDTDPTFGGIPDAYRAMIDAALAELD